MARPVGNDPSQSARQLAYLALRSVYGGAFAEVALDQALRQKATETLRERRLVTELVYGCVRRQRTLDAIIDQFAKKNAQQQPPDLRTLLHLGLYQLRYLTQIPPSAAVDTTVELAKNNGLKGLAGFVNGLLRQYIRQLQHIQQLQDIQQQDTCDPLQLPQDWVERLGILHSYPNWIIEVWRSQLPDQEVEQLCQWSNWEFTTSEVATDLRYVDLRVNPLRSSLEAVKASIAQLGITVETVPTLPQALRLKGSVGSIPQLPGFAEGAWVVQDSSAQMVSHLLDPQPGEMIIDACAAPGGKTTHIAELMGDRGTIWACDRTESRLRKLKENQQRLGLRSIQICIGDSRSFTQFEGQADRVLLDVPCSGLGTLHRHADARWRQTLETARSLTLLQTELLNHAATWVKPGGVLVYATCTLHPPENEMLIQTFLEQHPQWQIELPSPDNPAASYQTPEGWVKVWPHRDYIDGFFMVRLRKHRKGSDELSENVDHLWKREERGRRTEKQLSFLSSVLLLPSLRGS
jgi:16S rRNA (cytosine967-C5)-methyltransferase